MFKAGTYYVGDPCYVIDADKWQEFLEPYWNGEGEFEFEGLRVAAYRTMYGDGVYFDQEGNQYGVDAGMIGVIPMELVTKRTPVEIQRKKLGMFIEFKKPFSTESLGGILTFGHIQIDTN